MASTTAPHRPSSRLTQLARQRFVDGMCAALPALDKVIADFITQLMDQAATQRAMQQRRDAWMHYQARRKEWMERTARAWRKALAPDDQTTPHTLPSFGADEGLELLSEDVVENKLLASRMALTVTEQVASAFDTVRRSTQQLENQEMGSTDILRPETLCLQLVEQWLEASLEREELQLVLDPLQRELAAQAQPQYQALTQLFEEQGVVLSHDLRARMRRPSDTAYPSDHAPIHHYPTQGTPLHPLQAHAGGYPAMAPPAYPATMMGGAGPAATPGMGFFVNPFERARQHAQGVMLQLRRLLMQPATGYDPTRPAPPASQALMNAFSAQHALAETYYSSLATVAQDFGSQAVVQVAQELRQRSNVFKQKASSDSEKAIIEIVALMFQSILNEDRLPSSVRVWFARLQVPVLRVALAEPEFFNSTTHPARLLIDRMGSCVLGFDSAAITGSALEAEIRRIVQVIEQYPETGRRVFQLVHDEFEKFLARFLTEKKTTSHIVSVAQQMEQKETLAIQYTIELRTLLKDMPVRDEIREFLFKHWSEVLALSAVRHGAQHADTAAFKQTAADLVWAAGAKPNRAERTQVIQQLPGLLARLRQGLTLIGMQGANQDAQVKLLTDTLADAFLAKSATIAPELIDAMAKRLANLEDYLSDDGLGDIPLSTDNLEMLLGIDASTIQVIADTDAPVQAEMIAWAQQLALGSWFVLEHNGASTQVQYVWHSQRKQLHLFVAADGSSFLIQLKRLGAYLQANLLVAQEEETLTLRATREALAKIDANPERLLH